MMKNQNCVLCIQTRAFVYIKIDEMYKDIAEDIQAKFDTSNYEVD